MFINKKNMNEYKFIKEVVNRTNAQDGQRMVLYEEPNGDWCVRETEEFGEKFSDTGVMGGLHGNKLNIVIFGKAGCGKGTQAKLLVDKYGLIHISTGDEFRKHMRDKTSLGILAASYIDKGHLVPDDVTNLVLQNAIMNNLDAKGFIFDGYPRTVEQVNFLHKLMTAMNIGAIDLVAYLHVSDEELVRRLLERGKETGRSDDASVELIAERMKVYEAVIAPVWELYKSRVSYATINGLFSVEKVFELLCEKIDAL